MIKHDDNYHMRKYLVLFIIVVMIIGCGGPIHEGDTDNPQKAVIDKKDIITKHRAFNHFSKADLLERMGDLEKAADEYRLALVYDPASDEIKRLLANVYCRLKRYDEALDLSLQITNIGFDDLLLIADCYRLTGDEKMAVKYYEKATQIDSTLEVPTHFLAIYYSNKGDLKKAERYFQRLINMGKDSDKWRIELASFYIQTGKLEKAIKIYQEMINRDSSNIRGLLGLAAVREMQKDTIGADSLYKMIVFKNWNSAQILTLISQSFIRLNDIPMAIKVTKRITELFPDDYLTKRRYALLLFSNGDYNSADSVMAQLTESIIDDPVVYYYRGRIAQMNNDFARAESMYVYSLAINDTLSEVWVNLALTRAELGHTDDARATFDSAMVKCSSDSLNILFFYGVFLSRQENYLQACDYYKRVLLADPENTDVMFNLGAAYERGGFFDDAEKIFKKLIKLEPDNALALNYLGYMYADKGIKLKKARKMIKKALEIDPENSAYLDSYAWVLFKRGEYQEALEYQQKALRAGDDDAVLFDHMGDIYSALNKISEARKHWRKALELDPDNESIKQKLAR